MLQINLNVACREFADATTLVSGGNDRQLLLWQLADDAIPSDPNYVPCASWQHTRKINGLALSAGHIYVADTCRHVSIYSLT